MTTEFIAEGDLLGAAILTVLLLGILGIGELWARFGSPEAETSRKFVHLASAGACLLFPVLIESPFVVGAMAVGLSAFFAVAAYYKLLESLHSVERESRGSECYAAAIFLVFLLSGDDYWIYVVSILVLGVADASAALIGVKYGRFRYTVQGAVKSMEGSFAFFTIAFAAVLLPSPFLAELPWANLLHIAFATALLLTCFEAVSMHGADNLFVPVAAAVILEKLSAVALPVLLLHNLFIVGLFAAAFCVNLALRYFTSGEDSPFEVGAILMFSLFVYGAWALGGAPWVLPVVTGFFFAVATWLAAKKLTKIDLSIRIRPTYRALLLPFGVVMFAHVFEWFELLYGPYLAVGASVLAFAIVGLWRPNPEVRGPGYSTRFATVVGIIAGLAIAVPAWGFFPEVGLAAPAAIVVVTALISAVNYRLVERRRREGHEFFWPAPHVGLAFLAGVALFLAQYGELLPMWEIPAASELMRYEWTPWW